MTVAGVISLLAKCADTWPNGDNYLMNKSVDLIEVNDNEELEITFSDGNTTDYTIKADGTIEYVKYE